MQATLPGAPATVRERCPDHGTFMPCTLKDCRHGRKRETVNPDLPLVPAFGEKAEYTEERECFLGYTRPDPIMRHYNCTRRGHDWGDWQPFHFTEPSKPILASDKRVHFRQLQRTGYRRRCLMCGEWAEMRP